MTTAARSKRVVALPTVPPVGDVISITDWREFATSYTPHPLADLFPMLPHRELEELSVDIAVNGLLQPIVLDDEMRVVDGRNRLAAMLLETDLPIVPRFVRFSADRRRAETGVAAYIIARNINRRHLTPDQRAMIVAEVEAHYRDDANVARSEKSKGNTRAVKNSRVQTDTTVLAAPTPTGEIPQSLPASEFPKLPPTAPGAFIAPAVIDAQFDAIELNAQAAAQQEETQRAWQRVASKAGTSQRKARGALQVAADAPELVAAVASGKLKLHQAVKQASAAKTKPKPARAKTLAAAKQSAIKHLNKCRAGLADADASAFNAWVCGGCQA